MDEVELLVPNRLDNIRRRVTQTNVQRELSRKLPLIVGVHGVGPVTIVFG